MIRVTWASFNLEVNARCLYDYVEVFDNATAFPTGHTMGRLDRNLRRYLKFFLSEVATNYDVLY